MKLNTKKLAIITSTLMMLAPINANLINTNVVQTVQASRLPWIKFNKNTQIVTTKPIKVHVKYTSSKKSKWITYKKYSRVSMYNYGLTTIVTKQIAPSKFRLKDGNKLEYFTLKSGTYKAFQGKDALTNADNFAMHHESYKSLVNKDLMNWAKNYYKKHHIS